MPNPNDYQRRKMTEQSCKNKCIAKMPKHFQMQFNAGMRVPVAESEKLMKCVSECVESHGLVKQSTVRHPEIEALHTRVCNYLKQHIADEEKESKKYRQLQTELRKITNGHAYLDVLFQAQDEEVSQLKEAYRNYCKPGQR